MTISISDPALSVLSLNEMILFISILVGICLTYLVNKL